MEQQTAVEWLIDKISPYVTDERANPFIEQAKQMEQQQLKDQYMEGYKDGGDDMIGDE